MVFPNSVLLGQNLAEILFLLWLAFWTKKLQKHNWKRIPYGIAEKNSKKTQRLTHLWPKARSSFFSEWTVVRLCLHEKFQPGSSSARVESLYDKQKR